MAQTATLQIQMPEMGESVTEGIVLEWHVAEGDFVNEGDTVVEVSTDKVDAEVPAPTAGVITKLVASVDEEVPVGAPLAEMEPGEDDGSSRVQRLRRGPRRGFGGGRRLMAKLRRRSRRRSQSDATRRRGRWNSRGDRAPTAIPKTSRATPVARRVAQELGVDLGGVDGSGPGAKITKDDVDRGGQRRREWGCGAGGSG